MVVAVAGRSARAPAFSYFAPSINDVIPRSGQTNGRVGVSYTSADAWHGLPRAVVNVTGDNFGVDQAVFAWGPVHIPVGAMLSHSHTSLSFFLPEGQGNVSLSVAVRGQTSGVLIEFEYAPRRASCNALPSGAHQHRLTR